MTQRDKKLLSAWMRRVKQVKIELDNKAREIKRLMGEREGGDER